MPRVNTTKAIHRLEAFLKTDSGYAKALFLNAAAYFALGEIAKGKAFSEKLSSSQSGLINYLRSFAQLLREQGRDLECQRLLEAAEELKKRMG